MPRGTKSELEAENQFLRAELEAISDRLDDLLEEDDDLDDCDGEGFDAEDED